MAGRQQTRQATSVGWFVPKILYNPRVLPGLQVRANGLVVFVPKFGIEGPVHFDKDSAGQEARFTLDEEKQTASAMDGERKYTVSCNRKVPLWSRCQ